MTEATHTPDCASHGAIDLLPDECCDCGAVTQSDETWLPFDSAELAEAAGYTSGTLSNGDTFGDEDDPNPSHWLYDARCDPELFRSELERLQAALSGLEMLFHRTDEDTIEHFERVADAFYRETGYLRPGKDCRLHDPDVRREVYDKWISDKLARARAVLQSSGGK